MKKLWMIWVVTFWVMASASAQEYKFSKTGGRLNINLPVAVIEGTTGNDVVISVADVPKNDDERSKGLRTLMSDGLQDNTGLGINVSTKGNETDLNLVGQNTIPGKVIVKVPKGITVSLNWTKNGSNIFTMYGSPNGVGASIQKSIEEAMESAQKSMHKAQKEMQAHKSTGDAKIPDSILQEGINIPDLEIKIPDLEIKIPDFMNGNEIIFRGLDNPLEISVQYNSLKLENVTGPATINTVYGNVEATFDGNIKSPVSVVTVYGFVDVTLPETTRANVDFSTSMGELLVDPAFKFQADKSTAEAPKTGGTTGHDPSKGSWSKPGTGTAWPFGDTPMRFKGKLNGGGSDIISLKTTYGKVYVRKK